MDAFHEEVEGYIGGALRDIGATFIQHTRTGEGLRETNACFYSASDKIIAINHVPREGFACFIADARSAELSQHETWDTLWHVLGMDKNIDIETDEGLDEYLRMFPADAKEYMEFMGTCLVKYFGQVAQR
jgi:hypothetical protein